MNAREIDALLDEIEANQRAFQEAKCSWKRHLPWWLFRRQYGLCKANEPLFARLGVHHEPFSFESGRGR